MFKVCKSDVPHTALAYAYIDKRGAWVDCYYIDVRGELSLEDFVGRFYRSPLFRFERWIIEKSVGHVSSEAQLKGLLSEQSSVFSAWTQKARMPRQLIMQDYQKRTSSWFMIEPHERGANQKETRLYFGTIVTPTQHYGFAEGVAKLCFIVLLPVHGLYSRLLLSQAAKALQSSTQTHRNGA